MIRKRATLPLILLFASALLAACTSGPLKINQSGQTAIVVDSVPTAPASKTGFKVLIIPSGAVSTSVISDKAGTAGGIVGSMIVGPIAGLAGSLAGSTAGSHVTSEAEANVTLNESRQDISQAVSDARLPAIFSADIATQLSHCGIDAAIYPQTLEANNSSWFKNNLTLPANFPEEATPYRFFLQAGIQSIRVRNGLVDNTLEGAAYVRVYETRSLRQIGRYADQTGKSGSVTLKNFTARESVRIEELTKASRDVTRYLASGIGRDICSIMRNF
jgi:hypothetical protein